VHASESGKVLSGSATTLGMPKLHDYCRFLIGPLAISWLICGPAVAGTTSSPNLMSLLEKTGVVAQMEVMGDLIHQSSESFAERCGLSYTQSLLPSFETTVVTSGIVKDLQTFQQEYLNTMMHWFSSDLGAAVHEAEKADMDYPQMYQLREELLSDTSRVDLIKQIIENTKAVEFVSIIATEIEYAGILNSGCTEHAEQDSGFQQAQADVIRRDKFQMGEMLYSQIRLDLAYRFRQLTLQELAQYAEFTASEAAQRFYPALITAVDSSVSLASDRVAFGWAIGYFEF